MGPLKEQPKVSLRQVVLGKYSGRVRVAAGSYNPLHYENYDRVSPWGGGGWDITAASMLRSVPATRLMPTLPPHGRSCLVPPGWGIRQVTRACIIARRRVPGMPARKMPETVCPACTSAVSCLVPLGGKSARHASVQVTRGRVSGQYAQSYGHRSGAFAGRYSRTGSPPRLSSEAALRLACLGRPRSRKDGRATPT